MQTQSPAARSRPDYVYTLPIGERFVLWAMRQWLCELEEGEADGKSPVETSILLDGFRRAGLLEVLPDFSRAMDAVLSECRHVMEIHPPPSSVLSEDEALLVALCGLAQGHFDRPLASSLRIMLGLAASRIATARLKTFADALGSAGLTLGPSSGDDAGRLH